MKLLLEAAREEIISLRHTNEILAAKVQTMELFATVLHTEPARFHGGEAIDVAWQLKKKIDELKRDEGQSNGDA